MHERAGKVAQKEDLTDIKELTDAYYNLVPDVSDKDQQVAFGTSGHRGSSLKTAFNETHIAAITQAICEYRAAEKITGPLFMGMDTHGLSRPAQDTALEVLAANKVTVLIDSEDSFTPTPAVSRAIIQYNYEEEHDDTADGIVVTPSHNPPQDGGFKYNPPHGGPADSDATNWIADRANELIAGDMKDVKRVSTKEGQAHAKGYDFLTNYVTAIKDIIDIDAIKKAGVKIGADPLGGASVNYWGAIAKEYNLNMEVVNPETDPQWPFMTLDWDGKIRMDCSSAYVMASTVEKAQGKYDIATGNDADADRHGIVTADGLMNPNHYLAVAIEYLYSHRPNWKKDTGIGKTLVSSSMIDNVAKKLDRKLVEVPVGFKWFVPGLMDGSIGFGGEESAGASFLKQDGSVWTTDKDGILLCLLASEIFAVTGKTPSELYKELEEEYGSSAYARIDAPANREQKAKLAKLSPEDVKADELAGDKITAKLTKAPGNDAPIGGLKVTTEHAWFAARPSGTEDVYKIYAESFKGEEHLKEVQDSAKKLVDEILN
ncbi:MAG: phosphoglucomutase (alpha-D-glucose-1,6-bisphosphate-dependent) [Micrococcaceae bacterium]